MNTIVIVGATYLIILSPLIGGVSFLKQPRAIQKRMIILATVASIFAGVIVFVAGHMYTDPRPFVVGHFIPRIPHDPDNGFPSDHTLLTALAAAILYPFDVSTSLILWCVAVLVGVSRVFAGVHHPIDIIGSMLIAIIATAIAHALLKRYVYKKCT